MARWIKLEATGPIKIEPQEKPVFICACGLTENAPFCDGTHKACKSEEPGAVYRYDPVSKQPVRVDADEPPAG